MSNTIITPALRKWRIKMAAHYLRLMVEANKKHLNGARLVDAGMNHEAAEYKRSADAYLNGEHDNEAGAL